MAPPSSRSSIFQLLKQRLVGPKHVDIEISAYGKLPIYKDFLRQGLAAPEAQAFRRWLDRGVSKFWELHPAYREDPIPAHAMLVQFPSTHHQILAYLWDSHDHGGLRRFPFVLFISLPTSKTEAPLSLLHALDQFTEHAESMRRQLAQLDSLDQFYPLIRTARVQLEIDSDKSLKGRLGERQEPNLGDLGDIFYGEQDPQDRWPALIRHLKDLAQQPNFNSATRLPRTNALAPWELNALWCLLLKGDHHQARTLQLFYPTESTAGGVTVLHRDLRPDDIFAFHPEMPEYEGVTDLRRRVPGARPAPSEDPDPPAVEDSAEGAAETALETTSETTQPPVDEVQASVDEGPDEAPEESQATAQMPSEDTVRGDDSEGEVEAEEAAEEAMGEPTDELAEETGEADIHPDAAPQLAESETTTSDDAAVEDSEPAPAEAEDIEQDDAEQAEASEAAENTDLSEASDHAAPHGDPSPSTSPDPAVAEADLPTPRSDFSRAQRAQPPISLLNDDLLSD